MEENTDKNSISDSHKKPSFKYAIRKILSFFAAFLVVSASAIGSLFIISAINNSKPNTSDNYSSSKLEEGTPEYSTVLPTNKNIESMGGWTKVSPAGSEPVYAYIDKIGEVQINVSQQPLPDEFKTETADQIEELAKSFDANEVVIIDNIVVYIGTSAKGPQSVIFAKNNLLILIKSTSSISKNKWIEYIKLLK